MARSLFLPQVPKKTRGGWVFRDRQDEAEGFLALIGFALVLGLMVSLGLAGFFWFSDRSSATQPAVVAFVIAIVLALVIVALTKTTRSNADWHAMELTLSSWPVVIGESTAILLEQRRKNPVAEAPRLTAALHLRRQEPRKDGIDRTRTQDTVPVELVEQRELEPVRASFQLVVPADWEQNLSSSEWSCLLEIRRSFGDRTLGSFFPITVVA